MAIPKDTSALWRFSINFTYYPAVIILASWLDLKYFAPLDIPNLTTSFFFLRLGLMVLMGCLLALPSFSMVIKKHGSWNFDWIRFLALSIPIICCLLAPLVMRTLSMNFGITYLFIYVSPLIPIYGIVLGFTLLESFSK